MRVVVIQRAWKNFSQYLVPSSSFPQFCTLQTRLLWTSRAYFWEGVLNVAEWGGSWKILQGDTVDHHCNEPEILWASMAVGWTVKDGLSLLILNQTLSVVAKVLATRWTKDFEKPLATRFLGGSMRSRDQGCWRWDTQYGNQSWGALACQEVTELLLILDETTKEEKMWGLYSGFVLGT